MLQIIFWVSAVLLLTPYVIYPLGLALAAALFGHRRQRHSGRNVPPDVPVAVVIAAHDEEEHIEARLANLLAQSYPADKLHIYVGSDGSSDGTVAILKRMESPRVHVFDFSERRGKSAVLDDILKEVSEPVTVFTDANVEFEGCAVTALVQRLLVEQAGVVCGQLILRNSAGDNQDSVYWRIERFLKETAGRIDSLLGANGAIYAIRTELFEPLPGDTLIDDFVIPMRIASRGGKLLYEPEARAWEDTPDHIEDEFHRRVRIGMGNYQALFRYPQFLVRTSVPRAICYVLHKILRWFGPHFLLLMLITSACLVSRPLYAWLVGLQVVVYATLAAADVGRRHVAIPKWLSVLVLFANVNFAFAVAFWRYLSSGSPGHWTRTRRAPVGINGTAP
jgi:cellulose synthase/poly-beta-1,6-N-acetylglucosamine synthase-like glycosyltransferase